MDVNEEILKLLAADARMSWRQIGERVHLTGQAVATRVQQMTEQGELTGFTIRRDNQPRHYVLMHMNHPNFEEFEFFLQDKPWVEAAHKVAGEACYHLTVTPSVARDESLDSLLQELERFGRHRVLQVLRRVK